MVLVTRWWWPAFVFLSPLLFVPGPANNPAVSFQLISGAALLAFVGGLMLEAVARPAASLRDLARAPALIVRNPAAMALVALGALAVASAAVSDAWIIGLSGSLGTGEDGALWVVLLSSIGVLVYARSLQDENLSSRIVLSLVLSGAVLAAAAAVETALGLSILGRSVRAGDIPTVTFDGKGHLAGYLALSLAAGLGLWLRGKRSALAAVLLLSIGVGLTFNRAALLGASLALAAGYRAPARVAVAAVTMIVGVAVGWRAIQSQPSIGYKREVDNPSSLNVRFLLWKAAVGGIVARPALGWGGSQFTMSWHNFLPAAEVERVLQTEVGAPGLIRVVETPAALPLFILGRDGRVKGTATIVKWKAHNQILDLALMWGPIAALVYLGLIVYAVAGGGPAAFAILGYQGFLLLWFVPSNVEGTLIVLVGAAAADTFRRRSARTQSGTTREKPSVSLTSARSGAHRG